MVKIIPTTYQKLQRLATRADVAPSFLVSKEQDFRDAFVIELSHPTVIPELMLQLPIQNTHVR